MFVSYVTAYVQLYVFHLKECIDYRLLNGVIIEQYRLEQILQFNADVACRISANVSYFLYMHATL